MPGFKKSNPTAVSAADSPFRNRPSIDPLPFASQMAGRKKHPLGGRFGQTNFGVILQAFAPDAVSTLRQAHTRQDESSFDLEGNPTLHTGNGRAQLQAGMCAGFKAGSGNGHRLTTEPRIRLSNWKISDRTLWR